MLRTKGINKGANNKTTKTKEIRKPLEQRAVGGDSSVYTPKDKRADDVESKCVDLRTLTDFG